MKSTGIVRKVDELGRVVIPKELRRVLGIQDGQTSLEIFSEGDYVVIKKYENGCVLCGEPGVRKLDGKLLCADCIAHIKNFELF